MDAHRLGGVEQGGLGGEELGHARFHVAACAGVVSARRGLGEEARRLQPGGHLRELDLDRLVLADRLAEGLADLRVGDALLQGGAGDAASARRDVDPAELQATQDLLQPAALLGPHEVLPRDLAVVEDELAGVDPLVADLLELAHDPEPGKVLLHHEQAHAPVRGRGLRIGLDERGEDVSFDAVGDPHLGAVDHVAAVAKLCPGADPLQVRAAVGLGEGDRAAQLPARATREIAPLLRFGAEAFDGGGHDEVGVEDPRHRHPHRRDLLDDPRIGGGGESEAAVLLADGRAEEPELLHLLDDLLRPDVVLFELAHVGPHVAFEEAVDGVEDQGFVVVGDGGFGCRHRRLRNVGAPRKGAGVASLADSSAGSGARVSFRTVSRLACFGPRYAGGPPARAGHPGALTARSVEWSMPLRRTGINNRRRRPPRGRSSESGTSARRT